MLSPIVWLIVLIALGFLGFLGWLLSSANPLIKYGSAVVVAGLLLWAFLPKYNPLKKYGFDYRYESNQSPTLETIDFFINTGKGEIVGPTIIGDDLRIKFQDLEKTGIRDIVVTKEDSGSEIVVLKPVMKDGRGVGFHIVESRGMCLSYPEEGYLCP